MTETQQTISTWAAATFGPPEPRAQVARVRQEVEELLTALDEWLAIDAMLPHTAAAEFPTVLTEMADVVITMYNAAEANGVDLHRAIDAKMAVNRARKWKLTGGGTAQHVD